MQREKLTLTRNQEPPIHSSVNSVIIMVRSHGTFIVTTTQPRSRKFFNFLKIRVKVYEFSGYSFKYLGQY